VRVCNVPSLLVIRVAAFLGSLLRLFQLHSERCDDLVCDLILHGKDSLQFPVIALCPQVIPAEAIDESDGDTHAPLGLAHTPIQHIPDA
jgi:hypothetical protein